MLPSYDNRRTLTEKILACETKRSPLVRVQWTHTNDLHITLGFIAGVDEAAFRTIANGLLPVTQSRPFMANVEEIRLYGNAIVLRVEPYQQLLNIHKKMNEKLEEVSNKLYQFESKKRFDPHLTVGRIKNLAALNPLHKHQLMTLVQEQFRGYSFLIQQAALLRRLPENATPAYQSIQLYTLQG
jgi:2'-5' RNA ligase